MKHPEHEGPTGELRPTRGIEQPGDLEFLHADQRDLPLNGRQALALRLGSDRGREIYLLDAAESLPYLGARYLAIQPEVVLDDPRRGWRPFGGEHPSHGVAFGRSESPDFDLVRWASREHLYVWGAGSAITLVDASRHGTWWRQVDANEAFGAIRRAWGRA